MTFQCEQSLHCTNLSVYSVVFCVVLVLLAFVNFKQIPLIPGASIPGFEDFGGGSSAALAP